MSPAISFSEHWMVDKILRELKNQTIRPLGKQLVHMVDELIKDRKPTRYVGTYKEPRLKVGDLVKLYYKQRSTPNNSRFCTMCGNLTIPITGPPWMRFICGRHGESKTFPKLFANVVIKEVFEIIMGMKKVGKQTQRWATNLDKNYNFTPGVFFVDELSEKDGFEKTEESTAVTKMFNWFNKHYDLSAPKRFAVYRWKLWKKK